LGIPCGPINRLDQVFADPQVVSRGLRMDLRHPLAGTVPQVRAPLGLSATPLAYDRAPPLLGEHTAAVLSDRLGLTTDAIAALTKLNVIQI
jgi:crotonobetainyl-CoA:carnitine CoA-transferase CaiB-like acyl-CoA transferase